MLVFFVLLLLILFPKTSLSQITGVQTYSFSAPAPSGVGIGIASSNSKEGVTYYYYWVIARFPRGRVQPLRPFQIDRITPSISTPTMVRWNKLNGAIDYDVIRSHRPNFPNSCSECLVASGITDSFVIDYGSLGSYVYVNGIENVSANLQLNNRDFSVPRIVSDIELVYPGSGGGGLPVCAEGKIIKVVGGVWTCVDESGGGGGVSSFNGRTGIVTSLVGDYSGFFSLTTHNHTGVYSLVSHNHAGVYEPANVNIQNHISSVVNPHNVTKSQVGLGLVENTALSTWGGSSNIVTIGTLTSGTVPWARLSNIPSSFTPSAHTHPTGEITGLGGAALLNVGTTAGTVSAGNHTHTVIKIISTTMFDPVIGDSGRGQFKLPVNGTITKVACSVKAATSVTINLDKRNSATPDTTGTDVLSSGLVCDTNEQTSCASGCSVNTITSGSVTADNPVAITFSNITGVPDTLRIYVTYTETQ